MLHACLQDTRYIFQELEWKFAIIAANLVKTVAEAFLNSCGLLFCLQLLDKLPHLLILVGLGCILFLSYLSLVALHMLLELQQEDMAKGHTHHPGCLIHSCLILHDLSIQ